MQASGRRYAAGSLAVLGVVLLVVGLVAGVATREVLDADRFADHADSVRQDPDVARGLGAELTKQLLAVEPELVALRPLVEQTAGAVVSSGLFTEPFRAVVAPVHRALVSEDDSQVVLRLADAAALVVATLKVVAPEVRAEVPDDLEVRLAAVGGREGTDRLVRAGQLTGLAAWLLPLLGLLMLAGASQLVVDDRRRWVRAGSWIGGGLVAAAGVLAVLLLLVEAVAAGERTGLRAAVWGATWDQLDRPAWLAVVVAATLGGLLRLGSAWGDRGLLNDPVGAVRDWVERPATTRRERAVRGAVLLAVGLLLLVRPITAVAIVVGTIGLVLVAHALVLLVRAVPRPHSALVLATVRRSVAGALVALVVAALALNAWPDTSPRPVAGVLATTCNGHADLCARTYDAVAYPATHNSMSAADQPGWFLAEQPVGVIGQLDDGVRALLIDTWYGKASDRGVVATADRQRAEAMRQAEEVYGPELLQSALRLRRALGLEPRGEEGAYLCHGACELGSTRWQPLMAEVREWLEDHPAEVVTFIVQDEVSPADTAEVVADAGLMPYVHTQPTGEPWPTLAEMVESGRRVVFFMENRGGGTTYPWLHAAYDWIQETPYLFRSASQFTCAPNRGTEDAGLFLVNHWLSNPDRRIADADRVNPAAVLGARVRECAHERGLLPNFVAVNNYDRGDLFEVVADLNGL